VPYKVLLYDAPYSNPLLRRNELAVRVKWGEEAGGDEWEEGLEGPSDVE